MGTDTRTQTYEYPGLYAFSSRSVAAAPAPPPPPPPPPPSYNTYSGAFDRDAKKIRLGSSDWPFKMFPPMSEMPFWSLKTLPGINRDWTCIRHVFNATLGYIYFRKGINFPECGLYLADKNAVEFNGGFDIHYHSQNKYNVFGTFILPVLKLPTDGVEADGVNNIPSSTIAASGIERPPARRKSSLRPSCLDEPTPYGSIHIPMAMPYNPGMNHGHGYPGYEDAQPSRTHVEFLQLPGYLKPRVNAWIGHFTTVGDPAAVTSARWGNQEVHYLLKIQLQDGRVYDAGPIHDELCAIEYNSRRWPPVYVRIS